MTSFVNLFLIAVGLSMDAFAASICKGLASPKIEWKTAFLTAFLFGFFQAGMPLLGWLFGMTFAELIEPVDHWIACALLAAIGIKMIWDAFHDACDCSADEGTKTNIAELLVLSVATSIDALVAGISFSMTGIAIVPAVIVIGITTFALSLVGFLIGHRFGAAYGKPATIAGGIALIVLGLKILLEHLGVF